MKACDRVQHACDRVQQGRQGDGRNKPHLKTGNGTQHMEAQSCGGVKKWGRVRYCDGAS